MGTSSMVLAATVEYGRSICLAISEIPISTLLKAIICPFSRSVISLRGVLELKVLLSAGKNGKLRCDSEIAAHF